jgi:S-adenosylmethionine hydrolase
VTLTTDFGTHDHYVGALKGVMLGIAPDLRIIDITHDIEPYNVLHAAFVLRQIWSVYPAGTIHLAVVDPGVGSDRRIILGRYAGQYVIAPDNGSITLVHRELAAEAMYVVENPDCFLSGVSATFHGRDIMAPVAAHLALGTKPSEFGRKTDRIELLQVAHRAEVAAEGLTGSVLYVDRFGTLVTNIRREQLAGAGMLDRAVDVRVNDLSVGPIRSTFSDVAPGTPIAFIGSCELLEIAVNQGNAVDRFGPPESVRIAVR